MNTVIEDLAYVDIEKDGNIYLDYIQTHPEVYKLHRVMQFGLQYLLYTQNYLKSQSTEIYKQANVEKSKVEQLKSVARKQRAKIKKLKREIEEYDTRALHYDLLTDAIKPVIGKNTEFKNTETRKQAIQEATDPIKIKSKIEKIRRDSHLRQSEEDLLDSDFELSQSLQIPFGEKKSIPEAKVKIPDGVRMSRFNNPSTGIEPIYEELSDYRDTRNMSDLISNIRTIEPPRDSRSISEIIKERGLISESLSPDELTDSKLAESVTLWEEIK